MDKDYEEFVQRMGSFEMELEMDLPEENDELKHYGVLGMKWGVRKARETKGRNKSSKKAGPYTYTDTDGNTWTTSSPMTRAKEMERRAKYDKGKKSESAETKPKADSPSKEAIKKSKKLKDLSDDELKKYAERLRLENNLKRLTKETKSKRVNKDSLSNEDIKKINDRLQLEANLKTQVNTATATQRKLTSYVIDAAGQMVINKVLTGDLNAVNVVADTMSSITADVLLTSLGSKTRDSARNAVKQQIRNI